MRWPDLRGGRIVIWGTGLEGLSAARRARSLGGELSFYTDDETSPDFISVDGFPVPVLRGEPGVQALRRASTIIKSPGVSAYGALMQELRARGIPVTSLTALWMAEHSERCIGVTGSKGKSTTASLLAHVLNGLGHRVELGGNIGTAVGDLSDAADCYIVELSSYHCQSLVSTPKMAVITALFPDHLNWHHDIETYYRDKLSIIGKQTEYLIYNRLDPRLTGELAKRFGKMHPLLMRQTRWTVDKQTISGPNGWRLNANDTLLRGEHNLRNIAIVLDAIDAWLPSPDESLEEVHELLRTFVPLQHRLQLVSELGGISWIDDSLATTPEASIAALESFPDGLVGIIMGGMDRGLDYEVLRSYLLRRKAPLIVCGIPASGDRILESLGDQPGHKLIMCSSLDNAVNTLFANIQGGVALLSPGAPSYDSFANYEDRSRAYRSAIAAMESNVSESSLGLDGPGMARDLSG